MQYVTYSLKEKSGDHEYYQVIDKFSDEVMEEVVFSGKNYIDDFCSFILKNSMENIRSNKEYGLELLLIGIMIREYVEYARRYNPIYGNLLQGLNKLRKNEKHKMRVDSLKGRVLSKVIEKTQDQGNQITMEDFSLLIKWLDSTGDFKEEVYRLKNWDRFIKCSQRDYANELITLCMNLVEYFYNESKEVLHDYVEGIDKYLRTYKFEHINKEDIIYCGKGEIQYYFNMVSADTMNKIYREKFLKCKEKMILLPGCMRKVNNQCKSIFTAKGNKCERCTEECNIRKLTDIAETKGIEVFTIEHETKLFNAAKPNYGQVGVIGIACMLNLASGGWKALRLGFIPQCVILNYCGCKEHWVENPMMTEIKIDKLKELIEKC